MNTPLLEVLIAFNIAVLFWNVLLTICLLVDRDELLQEWRKSRKHQND